MSNVPSHFIIEMTTGGWDNNAVDDRQLPADYLIDYVRVWQRKDILSRIIRCWLRLDISRAGSRRYSAEEPRRSLAMTVSITIPADLQPFVEAEISTGRFENKGQLVTKSLELYREIRQRHDQLRTDQVQQSLDEAARGEVEDFDVEAIIKRGRERLAHEGLTN